MTYNEAVIEIEEIPKFTIKNPLEETRGFYNFLKQSIGFREEQLGKIIHVAGTNGKGSVCSFLNSICIEAGCKTGLFISPHLVTTTERFMINGIKIKEEEFVEVYERLKLLVKQYNEIKKDYNPTYFETLFFIMLLDFMNKELDYLILETGLGGLLDTTNIVEKPVLNIITEIGFDHMAYLGNTIEAIALQKAGIIKEGAKLVFTDKREEASQVIENTAKSKNVEYIKIHKNSYKINAITKNFIDFSVCNRYYEYNDVRINISALYQVENATLAMVAAEELKDTRISKDMIKKGISKMKWPGRMEEILPGILVDGAHNEDGIEAFCNTLKSVYEDNDIIVVFSAVNDKRYESMVKMILALPNVSNLVFTHIPGSRGTSLEELVASTKGFTDKEINAFEEISEAVDFGLSLREKQGEKSRVFFVGSLYLVGIIKDYFCEKGLEK